MDEITVRKIIREELTLAGLIDTASNTASDTTSDTTTNTKTTLTTAQKVPYEFINNFSMGPKQSYEKPVGEAAIDTATMYDIIVNAGHSALSAYTVLLSFRLPGKTYAEVGYGTLKRILDLSKMQTLRKIDQLVELGYVLVESGTGTQPNKYRFPKTDFFDATEKIPERRVKTAEQRLACTPKNRRSKSNAHK